MTNLEIIENERMLHDIDEELELNTFAGWKAQGLSVKKGAKALFTTSIWKPMKVEDEKEPGKFKTKLIMVKASFFSEKQVETAKERAKVK